MNFLDRSPHSELGELVVSETQRLSAIGDRLNLAVMRGKVMTRVWSIQYKSRWFFVFSVGCWNAVVQPVLDSFGY